MIDHVGDAHRRGGTLRDAFEATHAALSPKFGRWPIFEHCLPFDVQRLWDELDGIDWPRIWTMARDREVDGFEFAMNGDQSFLIERNAAFRGGSAPRRPWEGRFRHAHHHHRQVQCANRPAGETNLASGLEIGTALARVSAALHDSASDPRKGCLPKRHKKQRDPVVCRTVGVSASSDVEPEALRNV